MILAEDGEAFALGQFIENRDGAHGVAVGDLQPRLQKGNQKRVVAILGQRLEAASRRHRVAPLDRVDHERDAADRIFRPNIDHAPGDRHRLDLAPLGVDRQEGLAQQVEIVGILGERLREILGRRVHVVVAPRQLAGQIAAER